jgi:predicted nucleic-acid-binding protein
MKITPDTNVLVRAMTEDDARQSKIAQSELARADSVALTLPALCELVWVLSRGYNIGSPEIVQGIRALLNSSKISVDRSAAEAGLALLESGGDFADGVIAHEGASLGADVFVSFDKKAVQLIEARGAKARLLA